MSSVNMRARRLLLVVDADDDARTIVTTVLTAHGYAVAGARSVTDAARITATLAPDLVLLDVAPDTLDDTRGALVVRDAAPHIPLVPVSTSAHEVTALRAAWRATAALCKPFEIRVLLDLVELLCPHDR